jgi:hypothetical protein
MILTSLTRSPVDHPVLVRILQLMMLLMHCASSPQPDFALYKGSVGCGTHSGTHFRKVSGKFRFHFMGHSRKRLEARSSVWIAATGARDRQCGRCSTERPQARPRAPALAAVV